MVHPQKAESELLPQEPEISLLGTQSKKKKQKLKARSRKGIYKPMFTALFTITKR